MSGENENPATGETTTTEPQPRDEGGKFSTKNDSSDYLRDEGKKAIDSMKEERNKAKQEAKAAREEAEKAKSDLAAKSKEYDDATQQQENHQQAIDAANQRVIQAAIREKASTKMNDAADALRFIDVSEFQIGSDGSIDYDAIEKAVDDLVSEKSYLAAQGGRRFQGSADGGTRNGDAGVVQLTQDDLKKMNPHEIVQAKYEGKLDQLMGRS